MILGGAVGNLVDRALTGEVIDFIQIGFNGHYWPVFNVADMAVTIGATLLVIAALRTPREPAPDGVPAGGADEHAPGR
jgi:signal peptidase II